MTSVRESEYENVFYVEQEGREHFATKNLAPGISVYGERLVKFGGVEYRIWDPFRSKLCASLIKKVKAMPIKKGTYVLYLGASTGTTVSHVSDIIENGIVFGVEVSARVARELIDRVAKYRKNVIPIVTDARYPQNYRVVFRKVDVVYSDIAQPDATEITLLNVRTYLKPGGYLMLVVKARSIDPFLDAKEIVKREEQKVRDAGLEVIDTLYLDPFDKEHGMVVAKLP